MFCMPGFMTTQLRVAILCILMIMLSSCSSKYGSKEEAYNAQREFINNGKQVVIIDAPTDIEVQKERTRIAAVRKFSCPAVKQIIDDGVTYKLQEKRAYIENECYEGAPIKASKETMTKREVLNTRDCFFEEETSQFVCKEWKISSDEMAKEKWLEVKPVYSYFRY